MRGRGVWVAALVAGGATQVLASPELVGVLIGGTLLGVVSLIALLVLIKVIANIKVIEKGTAMVIERFGKFHKRLDAGLYFLIPYVDRPRPLIWRRYFELSSSEGRLSQTYEDRIDLRECVMDFPTQEIITRDNVKIRVQPMILYRIVDPVRAVYEISDLPQGVENLIHTTLRSIIGDMGLDDTLASREEINRSLQQKIHSVFLNWGFKLIKVDILEIKPATDSIQTAMDKQISAERMRRAALVEADGFREQTKMRAEGNLAASVNRSKGNQQVSVIIAKAKADAKLLKVDAEAQAIRILANALKELDVTAAQYIIALKYIQALKSMASRAGKRQIYIPIEHDVVGALGVLVPRATAATSQMASLSGRISLVSSHL